MRSTTQVSSDDVPSATPTMNGVQRSRRPFDVSLLPQAPASVATSPCCCWDCRRCEDEEGEARMLPTTLRRRVLLRLLEKEEEEEQRKEGGYASRRRMADAEEEETKGTAAGF
jgi:hypothetical protein